MRACAPRGVFPGCRGCLLILRRPVHRGGSRGGRGLPRSAVLKRAGHLMGGGEAAEAQGHEARARKLRGSDRKKDRGRQTLPSTPSVPPPRGVRAARLPLGRACAAGARCVSERRRLGPRAQGAPPEASPTGSGPPVSRAPPSAALAAKEADQEKVHPEAEAAEGVAGRGRFRLLRTAAPRR